MSDVILIILFLACQLAVQTIFGGNFCDFLTPLLLLWAVTKPPTAVFIWTAVLGLLASALFPQAALFFLVVLLLGQWLLRATFVEEWRRRASAAFFAGLLFSAFWQGLGLLYGFFFAKPLQTPLCFPPLISSILTAGILTALIFRLTEPIKKMKGEKW